MSFEFPFTFADFWFCTQCREWVQWVELDLERLEDGEQKCLTCVEQ